MALFEVTEVKGGNWVKKLEYGTEKLIFSEITLNQDIHCND